MASHLKLVDGVVLDMRGNGGGDDSKGYDLAALFAGQHPKTPYAKQWTNRTPEAMQLFINSFSLHKKIALRDGKPFKHFDSLIQTFEKKRDLAVEGNLPEHPFLGEADLKKEEFDFDYEKSIKKPIYVLIDAECASSCESTTDFFEYNSLVTTLGENTAGYLHFGNNGILVLNHSGVVIQMAVSYNAYKDGRFLEKKGISPDVKVADGKNAMDVALDELADALAKKEAQLKCLRTPQNPNDE